MSDQVTLERVERLATQLSPQEQLKLVAHITGRLSIMLPAEPAIESEQEKVRQERLKLAEELLAEVEDIEDDSQGETDAAALIRKMRAERIAQICQKGA
ncbi:MAG: hypothetical protein ACETWB_02965 [Anaerolineae bacterium]